MSLRDQIVAEARTWIGTPYHHEARLKGVGVDCATFIYEVLLTVHAMEPKVLDHYSTNWFLHTNDERYMIEVMKIADEIEAPKPGDLAMFKYGRAYAHAAIVLQWPIIVHASRQARAVVFGDASVDGELLYRNPRFFQLKVIAE
jgi:NlpC/P60 family putative phage cell wall peptidase